jgi:hypothetical protein
MEPACFSKIPVYNHNTTTYFSPEHGVIPFKTLVYNHKTTWSNNKKYKNLNSYHHENIKS